VRERERERERGRDLQGTAAASQRADAFAPDLGFTKVLWLRFKQVSCLREKVFMVTVLLFRFSF